MLGKALDAEQGQACQCWVDKKGSPLTGDDVWGPTGLLARPTLPLMTNGQTELGCLLAQSS